MTEYNVVNIKPTSLLIKYDSDLNVPYLDYEGVGYLGNTKVKINIPKLSLNIKEMIYGYSPYQIVQDIELKVLTVNDENSNPILFTLTMEEKE